MQYPFSDEYMTVEEFNGHYVLTEKALTDHLAVDLRARLAQASTVNPENVIGNFLRTVSDMVYQFIHEHNADNFKQDKLIATVPELRQILQRAMEYQAMYVLNVGNLYLSANREERAAAIDPLCRSILGNVIPRIGISILYGGKI